MTFTFDQMSRNADGLPEKNVRKGASAGIGAVSKSMKDMLIQKAKDDYQRVYGAACDTVDAAEVGNEFVCMAYRMAPD